MARVVASGHAVAWAVPVLLLLAGCSHPGPRDPGSEPLPAGKGALLADLVTEGDQQRVAGAQVVVSPNGGYGVSDDLGHVVIPLSPGHYKAVAAKQGYEAAPVEFDITAGEYNEQPIFMSATSNPR